MKKIHEKIKDFTEHELRQDYSGTMMDQEKK